MKKYLKSGFNTTQNIKLEAGTYSLVVYVKSLYGNTYTFALGYDGAQGVEWTEYDVDVVKNQLCKVWFTFTITEKITKLKPISSNFSASLPVYVADLQLTRGNVPVESGASPFDFDEIINDVGYDYESKIKQAADKISLAVYDKTLDALNPATEIKLTSDSIKLTVASDIADAKSGAITDVTEKLLDTGINITNKQINLTANKTVFKNNSGGTIALFNPNGTKINASAIELTASDQITLKVNAAKDEAVSTAATDATTKVNGLKTSLSGTGIDITEKTLTLYSGVKGGNAGGQIIIAGSNFSVDANGKVKAVDGEFSGKISASSGDIGVLVVEENGNVAMQDPNTLIPRLVFSKANLPLIGDLTGGVNSSGGMDVGSGYLSGATSSFVTLSGSTNVTKAGAEVTYSGARINLNGSGTAELNGMSNFIEAGLYLYVDNVQHRYLGSARIFFTDPVGQQSFESDYVDIPPMRFTLSQAGLVTMRLEVRTSMSRNVSLTHASITSSRLDWTHIVQGIKRQQYGLDGMMFFYSNNWFHFTEFGGLVLGGKTDMPGVLLSGTVNNAGGGENFWGAKQSGTPPVRNSTGRYTVYHTIGHSRYSISALPKTANRSCNIVSQSNTNFVLEFRSIGSSPALADTAFTVQVTGDNY